MANIFESDSYKALSPASKAIGEYILGFLMELHLEGTQFMQDHPGEFFGAVYAQARQDGVKVYEEMQNAKYGDLYLDPSNRARAAMSFAETWFCMPFFSSKTASLPTVEDIAFKSKTLNLSALNIEDIISGISKDLNKGLGGPPNA